MAQSKLSSILEIAKGTIITLAVTGVCNLFFAPISAFTASLFISTALKYALRRYYNGKVEEKK